jgi:hypothetical protein
MRLSSLLGPFSVPLSIRESWVPCSRQQTTRRHQYAQADIPNEPLLAWAFMLHRFDKKIDICMHWFRHCAQRLQDSCCSTVLHRPSSLASVENFSVARRAKNSKFQIYHSLAFEIQSCSKCSTQTSLIKSHENSYKAELYSLNKSRARSNDLKK